MRRPRRRRAGPTGHGLRGLRDRREPRGGRRVRAPPADLRLGHLHYGGPFDPRGVLRDGQNLSPLLRDQARFHYVGCGGPHGHHGLPLARVRTRLASLAAAEACSSPEKKTSTKMGITEDRTDISKVRVKRIDT